MKKEIRIKRNKLKEGSVRLRSLSHSWDGVKNYDLNLKIREEQDAQYKKYRFYDKFIKASDKIKSENDRFS